MYYGRIRPIDTSGNAGPWTPASGLKTSTATELIESSHIRSLTAAKITSGVINAHEIILKQQGNQTQIAAPANMAIIRSSDYDGSYTSNTWTPGTTGWVIAGNGYAEFSSASIRGGLVAGSIFINADNRWKTEANGAATNTPVFKAGSANNYVLYDGIDTLSVKGNVTATSGKIAGWNISGNALLASDFSGKLLIGPDTGANQTAQIYLEIPKTNPVRSNTILIGDVGILLSDIQTGNSSNVGQSINITNSEISVNSGPVSPNYPNTSILYDGVHTTIPDNIYIRPPGYRVCSAGIYFRI